MTARIRATRESWADSGRRRYLHLHLPLILSLVTATACSGGPDEGSHYLQTKTDEEGLPVAVASGVPRFDLPLFTFVEITRLHEDESLPESLLNRAYDYRRGSDGRFYVADWGNQRIAVFGPDGEFQQAIGRSGDGPGELRFPSIQSADEGGVTVWDLSHRNLSRFTLEGLFQETIQIPTRDMIVERMTLEEEGVVLERTTTRRNPDLSFTNDLQYTLVNPQGDTLGGISTGPVQGPRMFEMDGGDIAQGVRPFFGTPSISYVKGVGFVAWDGSNPELHIHALDGRKERTIRIEWDADPVTSQDRAAAEAYYRRSASEAAEGYARSFYEGVAENLEFGVYKPYFNLVRMDDQGYLWIGRNPDYSAEQPFSARTISVLGPDGEYLGDTRFPAIVTDLSGGYLCTRMNDEATGGLKFIVFEIRSAIPGFSYP